MHATKIKTKKYYEIRPNLWILNSWITIDWWHLFLFVRKHRCVFFGSSFCFLIVSWYDDGTCGKFCRDWPHRDEFHGGGRSHLVINNNTMFAMSTIVWPHFGEKTNVLVRPQCHLRHRANRTIPVLSRHPEKFQNKMTLARALSWHTLLSMWMDIMWETVFEERSALK